jgi:ankyrin repeat protein
MNKLFPLIFILLINQFTFSQDKLDLFEIARRGTVDQVEAILYANKNAFNIVNNQGFSPLVLACYNGNNKVAKLLVETGCDINSNSKMGTPLMATIVKGNIPLAKLLIEKNADLNLQDTNGTTALIYAVQFQNLDIIKLLIQHNVDKTHKDNLGKTAFEYAVFSKNDEIINLLK